MSVDTEIVRRAYDICTSYMGGVWRTLEPADLKVEPIGGGLSNQLFLCRIASEDVVTAKEEPRELLMRLYGQIILESREMMVNDSVVFALLAEKAVGPRLYAIFPEGRLEQYIPSRPLLTCELRDPGLSRSIARRLAAFHALDMPLCKDPTFTTGQMAGYGAEVVKILANNTDSSKAAYVQRLRGFNLPAEHKALMALLATVASPVVLCHNDLQEGNILLRTGGDQRELTIIDFEYASYNYRGFDLGNHFNEWCYDYAVSDPPYFKVNLDNYPSLDQQKAFLSAYLEASCGEAGTLDALLREAATYALMSHFYWGLWALVMAKTAVIHFNYWEYAIARFDAYFKQKAKLPGQSAPEA